MDWWYWLKQLAAAALILAALIACLVMLTGAPRCGPGDAGEAIGRSFKLFGC